MEQGMKDDDAQDGRGSAAVDVSYPSFNLHEALVLSIKMPDLLGRRRIGFVLGTWREVSLLPIRLRVWYDREKRAVLMWLWWGDSGAWACL